MQTLEQLFSGQLLGVSKLKLSCGLKEFPKEILDLSETLEYLDLSGNELSKLPFEFSKLKKLKIAFFSNNLFTEFPKVLGECPMLDIVGFKANKINYVASESLSPSLRWLILTDNLINEIPASIATCKPMQKLMLAGNQLTDLPKEMAQLENLQLLRISANNFQELPSFILEMPKLAWLAFSGNPYTVNPNIIQDTNQISWETLRIDKQLGEGASGNIFKAQLNDIKNKNKDVAIKIFKGTVTSDGLPADEMYASLKAGKHINLVTPLCTITNHPANKAGLVLELIPENYSNLGRPPDFNSCTRDIFPETYKINIATCINISLEMADALMHLHRNGIMHGDFYAHNILIGASNHSLLGDFGAATCYNVSGNLAKSFEAIEVRAFGYLLEDLISLLKSDKEESMIVNLFNKLIEECLSVEVAKRPTFLKIYNKLKSFTTL